MNAEEVREYWRGFPESPYSDTFKWVDADGYEHMMTFRGYSGTEVLGNEAIAKKVIAEQGGKPVNKVAPAPSNVVPARDENGTPVVDGNTGEPVMTSLPEGTHLFTVAGLVHDKNKDKTKDILKVFTVETPYNKGYGVACFHPSAEIGNWKAWTVTSKDNKAMYAPPETCKHVIIRDAKEGGYPDVVEFRA